MPVVYSQFWPGGSALGKRISFGPNGNGNANANANKFPWRTVVGVVADVRYHALGEVQFDVYDPAMQTDRPIGNVVVRTRAGARATADVVRAAARALDATAIVDEVTTMAEVVGRAEAPWRLATPGGQGRGRTEARTAHSVRARAQALRD